MNVVVIGSGGREHALVWKISQSPKVKKIYALPGNGGIKTLAECVDIKADDIAGVVEFCKKKKIDIVVVGPEAPLSKGLADTLRQFNIPTIGPNKEAAKLEASKLWAKNFMLKHGIPTARYKEVTNKHELIEASKEFKYPIVVKMDGLYAGKGVFICDGVSDYIKAGDAIYGSMDSGEKVIVEEFLAGEEASYMIFTDGKNYLPLATSRDHKRIYDGEKGPNTGGMGAVSPAPINAKTEAVIEKTVIKPLLKAMKE
ncbi:MAG: phosphoribosylamine--glycine ligase, partial [Pseudomonadota bacterium]